MKKINLNPDTYISWDYLCPIINSTLNVNYGSLGVNSRHKGLSVDGKLPHSISEYEFNYMKDFIIKNNLTNGFDLSTGTGISALGIGLGMKKTKGKLLSVDSYVEFENGHMIVLNSEEHDSFDSELYKNNKKLIELFNLQDNVELKVGVSPHDCVNFLEGKQKLDFVFFDCPKSKEDFIRDATYVKDNLNTDKFVIFWHDTHVFMEDFKKLSIDFFGIESKQLHNFKFGNNKIHQHFPLSMITNIETETL